ncbi:MAG: hypothetical protein WBA73_17105, partial [Devosia sp.]
MQSRYLFSTLLTTGLLFTCWPAQAQQFSTVSEVLRECPDLDRASACPTVAQAFLSLPNSPNDTQIVTLVVTLAAAAQEPRVPRPVCLNTAEGIRVLATGVDSAGTAGQIRDIADALCFGIRTAGIAPLANEDGSDNNDPSVSDGNGVGVGVVPTSGNGGANGSNGG